MNNRLIFIISHKYFRGYESYIEYYVNNIQNFYENALTIIVDNNSEYKEDVFINFMGKENIILLDNNIDSKFEIGAYTVGLKYIIDNNLQNQYDYIVLTQDTFVIKNKFNFETLSNIGVTSCPLVGIKENSKGHNDVFGDFSLYEEVLSRLNLYNNMDKISFCWCNSFAINTSKTLELFSYFSKIKIVNRVQSCDSERFLARIIYELNEGENYSLDSDFLSLKYDCHSVDIRSNVEHYFVKRSQGKTELTKNKI